MSKNVTNLRKAGNLNEAFRVAQTALDARPDDMWCKKDMAWVLYDFAKQKATVDTKDQFVRCLDKLLEVDLPEDDDVFYNGVGFLIRGMAATMIRAEKQDSAFFDVLFSRIKSLKIKRKTPVYSSLMTVMLRTKDWWKGFKAFCEWWGFENFMDEDYLGERNEERGKIKEEGGKIDEERGARKEEGAQKKIMPLAERVVMAYCRCLLDGGSKDEVEKFLPWLDEFSAQHKNYIYLPFYGAKLLWAAGRKDEYFAKMKIFARKKSGEFWVWDLLGDYYDDKAMRLKFYAKGLSCRSKAEMSVKLREKTGLLLMELGYDAQALSELMFVAKIREKNKWGVGRVLSGAIDGLSKKGVKPSGNNKDFFEKLSADAEQIVLGGKAKKPVSKINNVKREESFDFEGKIKVSDGGFGFVRYDGKTIFVPANLVKDKEIADGSVVKGRYVKSFDKKKNKDGYKAVKIEN